MFFEKDRNSVFLLVALYEITMKSKNDPGINTQRGLRISFNKEQPASQFLQSQFLQRMTNLQIWDINQRRGFVIHM